MYLTETHSQVRDTARGFALESGGAALLRGLLQARGSERSAA